MVKASKPVSPGALSGNHIFYGVREFGMCAVMNGLALHGGLIPYGGTFLVFSDYARNALRLAALMGVRVIYVFTHDSIGLGEDGPTHQPIEHAASLRLMPNMDVWRPCDTVETAVGLGGGARRAERPDRAAAYAPERAVREKGFPGRTSARAATCFPTPPTPGRSIIATGSEVQLALGAQKQLGGGRHRRCAWSPCLRPAYSTARTPNTGTRCCRRDSHR